MKIKKPVLAAIAALAMTLAACGGGSSPTAVVTTTNPTPTPTPTPAPVADADAGRRAHSRAAGHPHDTGHADHAAPVRRAGRRRDRSPTTTWTTRIARSSPSVTSSGWTSSPRTRRTRRRRAAARSSGTSRTKAASRSTTSTTSTIPGCARRGPASFNVYAELDGVESNRMDARVQALAASEGPLRQRRAGATSGVRSAPFGSR